jgi:cobyrinic acid a,c-diamide synthase
MSAFVIAGTHSGCGKTTITLALLAALKKRGLSIQSFKAGPDFIDGGLHRLITGKPSRNLDLWMCGEEYVKACFYKHSKDVDISIVEGVMGLYDGDFSTAKLAEILNLPIILVVDAYGMAESAGAIVKGFVSYISECRGNGVTAASTHRYTDTPIVGVIFNRIASERHYERVKNSVHDVPILGYLPRKLNFEIPHRHLGLTVAEENPITEKNIEELADAVLEHIDVKEIIEQQSSKGIGVSEYGSMEVNNTPLLEKTTTLKIAVAYDKAFCFYYEDNLDLLKEAGAEIVKFSPLFDKSIPDADALYIGGGYPELYAKELSANASMLASIKKYSDTDMPIYAECGGLMYLSKGIYDFDGNFFEMANILPFETQMTKSRPRLGYREAELTEDCIIGKKGDKLRGHEFHYSEIKQSAVDSQQSEVRSCYAVFNNKGQNIGNEGYRFKNTLASYVHVHFGSNPAIAENFINFIKGSQWKT